MLKVLKILWQNVVGFVSDSCNMMIGSQNSVLTRVKEKQPNVFNIGCICHLENLCELARMKALSVSVDDFFVDIYFDFDQSVNSLWMSLKYLQMLSTYKYSSNAQLAGSSSAYCGACAHPVPSPGGIFQQSLWCGEGRENKTCNGVAERPSNKTHPALPQLHPTCHEWLQQTLPVRWNRLLINCFPRWHA